MLIVVRHGRTGHNAAGRFLGRIDAPLDDLGARQAQALGRSPLLSAAVRVVASPLARAADTARALGPPVTLDDRWIEIDYGIHDGEPVGGAPLSAWRADPEWCPEGGESLAAVGRRVRAACDELWEEARARDVVVVTHVSPIRAAVKWALGVPDVTELRLSVATASVTRIGPARGAPPGTAPPALHSFNETDQRPDR